MPSMDGATVTPLYNPRLFAERARRVSENTLIILIKLLFLLKYAPFV